MKSPVTKLSDRFLGYCAVTPNKKFMRLFKRADVKNVLISYHYIRKNPEYTKDVLNMIRGRGGLFMTDSGAFSFLNDKSFDPQNFDWFGYLHEYVNWLKENKEYVFSACNLDVDYYVGHDEVVRWNKEFFEPLEKDINIIYVAHPNAKGNGELDVLKEYCKRYNYVAVNEMMAKQASAIYQMAKQTKTVIHGLAWTKPTILKDFPFFSVDSSSWVNYQKFGATPVWDGRNFTQYDKDNKSVRRTLRKQCQKYGIKEYEFINEKNKDTGTHNDDEGLTYSLRTWLDVFQDLKRYARTKLTTDLKKMLENKKTVFTGDTPARKETGKKEGSIMGALDDLSLDTTEAKLVTYQVDDNGNEVALYKKRAEKTEITKFVEQSGDAMVCDFCHLADRCPKFKEGSTCAFDFAPVQFTESPIATLDMLIKVQTERVQRSMFIEKMEGGMTNKTFTMELKLLNELNNTKTNMLMMIQGKGLRITQTTLEMDGMPNSGDKPRKAGFAQLLQSMMKKE